MINLTLFEFEKFCVLTFFSCYESLWRVCSAQGEIETDL